MLKQVFPLLIFEMFSANYVFRLIVFRQSDANGNMVMDVNKGIMIQYNHLNLPRTVTFADGKTITWIYDATGRKLQKRTCELRSGAAPIVISDVKRPNYIDPHRHQSERIKHISTNRTPAETTLNIIDYYNATNFITPKSPKGDFI